MPKSHKEESGKSNPYIGKSISKSLLTPCRRVGLPRKRKSSANNSVNQSLFNIELMLDKNIEETVPIVTKSPELSENNQHEVLNEKVVQYLETSNDQNRELEEIMENNQKRKEDNLDIVDRQDTIIQTKRKQKSKKSKKESKTEKDDTRSDKNKKKSKVESSRPRSPILFDEDDDEDFVADDQLKIQQIKNMKEKSKSYDYKLLDSKTNANNRELMVKLRRIDSEPPLRVYTNKNFDKTDDSTRKDLKIPDLNDDQSFQTKKTNRLDLKESNILSLKNKQDPPELPKLEPVSPAKKQRKIKRSLSLKKTPSDGPILDLSDDFENYPPPLLQINPNKIDELEREMAKKREILENLQQTEIYKRLHNVAELAQLTQAWKTGCISAINDLLPKLKPYAEIDMETLLGKLKVPEHLIKLSPAGELI